MSQENEKNLQEVLSEKLDQFYPEEKPAKEEVVAEQEPAEEEETKIDEEPDAQEDDAKEITENEEDEELSRKISGQPKEFKELVKSVKDPETRAKILEAGKVARAREDRLSLELGNLKKEFTNVSGLVKNLETNPAETIKQIAKVTKVDLSSLVEKPIVVEDEYDYRTPEEKARDKKLQDIEQELSQLKNQKIQEQRLTVAQEIDNFKNAKDEKGGLKYPHFDRVRTNMSLFFSDTNPEMTMDKAYQKAILLDDELVTLRDATILKQAADKRKEEIEKAKRLKKFSNRSSNVNVKPASARAALDSIVDDFYAGTL